MTMVQTQRMLQELLLLRKLASNFKKLRLTGTVDDDFPEVLHQTDASLSDYEKLFGDPRAHRP